ncbi:MAG: phosphotransferase, partial [Actinomycetota bacterium]
GELDGRAVAVRRTARSVESLEWELDLVDRLDAGGFLVPEVIATSDGRPHADGIVVQRWIDGDPPTTADDWSAVASELQRLHVLFAGHPQRPGCVTVSELVAARRSGDADLDAIPQPERSTLERLLETFGDVRVSVIHGDPGPSNLRITPDGRVGLLDWDESRVDVVWHDLSELGVPVLHAEQQRRAAILSDVWEAANGWVAEPEYARRRFESLLRRVSGG